MVFSRRFIENLKLFFTQIQLDINNEISSDTIYYKMVVTSMKIKDLSSLHYFYRDYFYFDKRIKRIKRVLNNQKKRQYYENIQVLKSDLYETHKKYSSTIITNVLSKNRKDFIVFDEAFESKSNHASYVERKGSKYIIFSDGDYYGVDRGKKFSIYTNNGNEIVRLKYRDRYDLSEPLVNLIKNSDIQVDEEEGFVEIYDLTLSEEESISFLAHDIWSKKEHDIASCVAVFDDYNYLEITALIAIAMIRLTSDHFKAFEARRNAIKYSTWRAMNG